MSDNNKMLDFTDKYQKDITDYYNRMAGEIKGKTPKFVLSPNSSSSYYALEENIIHIGFNQLSDFDNDTKIKTGVEGLIGHEIQHKLSTTARGWDNAITNGARAFVRYCAKQQSVNIGREDDAYIKALELTFDISTDRARNVFNILKNMANRIVNSIEDGRIERIRAFSYPGYKKKCVLLRYYFWKKTGIGDFLKQNPFLFQTKTGILEVVLNNILSLSTCKYFIKDYEYVENKKECDKYIKDVLDDVRAGVKANTCREMSECCIKICEGLSPLVYEVLEEALNQDDLENLANSNGGDLQDDDNSDGEGNGENGDDNNKEDGSDNNQSGDSSSPSIEDLLKSLMEQGASNNDMSASDRDEMTGEDIPDDFDISKDNELSSGDLKGEGEERQEKIKKAVRKDIKVRQRPYQAKIDVIGKETALPDIIPLVDTYGHFEEIKRPYELRNSLPNDLLSQGEDLKRRIKEALTIRTNTARHKKSGKIRGNDIVRLGFNDTDIFNNRETNPADVVCYILADNSGSMGDGVNEYDNRYHELRSLAVIEHAFGDYIPLKIASFNTWDGTIHRKLKDFDEKVFNNSSYNFLVECGCEGANDDAFSIAVATQELLARTETNKLLFVLSDGLPCSNEDKLTEEVKKARAMGIKLVPIYFGSEYNIDRYKELYIKDYIIAEPKDIGVELERVLTSFCFS